MPVPNPQDPYEHQPLCPAPRRTGGPTGPQRHRPHSDGAGTATQPRQRFPLPGRQLLSLPQRLCRTQGLAAAHRHGSLHPVLPAQGPGARDLGRLPPRPGRSTRGAGRGPGLCRHRAGQPAADAAGRPRRGLVSVCHPRRTGEPCRGLDAAGPRPGALRRAVPRRAARPVRTVGRNAPGEGHARDCHHAPRRPDQRRRPHPCHAPFGADAARRPGRARVPPGSRVVARVSPAGRAVSGLRLHRRRRCQRLCAALPRRPGGHPRW